MNIYRARNPRKSPLWQCTHRHFSTFLARYPEDHQPRHGLLRPTIPQVVDKFLNCGTLERGFARIRCDNCGLNALLAFSGKSRWFCPSCHQKNVQTCSEFLVARVLAAVPHRHYVLALQKMLRAYFQRHRPLLKHLCTAAHQSLTLYLRSALGKSKAHPALILTLHTFGEYLDFHPHIHALVADGLFTRDGQFHPLSEFPVKPLEEIFRAHVIQLLVDLDLLPHDRVRLLHSWKHTGFNVHRGESIPPENKAVLEQLAQYILRNPFSVAKMTLHSGGEKVIYRSKLNPKINRNFEIFTGPDFLATITQYIPDKGAQMIRYYGWYSNKMRGQRHRVQNGGVPADPLRPPCTPPPPAKLPSKKWRDVILKVWQTDPLICPHCQHRMRVLAVIDQRKVIEKILLHLNLWSGLPAFMPPRGPPPAIPKHWEADDPQSRDPFPDYDNVFTD